MTLVIRDEVIHQALPCGCAFVEGIQTLFCQQHPTGIEKPEHIVPVEPPVDTKPSKADRPVIVTKAAQIEAQKHYGDKFAFAFVICYKDEDGELKVDTGCNVSRDDQAKLYQCALEAVKQPFDAEKDRFVVPENQH